MAKAIGYVVLHSMDYSDIPENFVPCRTRADVEAQLVDLGYMRNPGVWAYKVTKGVTAQELITELVESHDPYPDFTVEYGPRGGYVWQCA